MGISGCAGGFLVIAGFFFWPLWILALVCLIDEGRNQAVRRHDQLARQQWEQGKRHWEQQQQIIRQQQQLIEHQRREGT